MADLGGPVPPPPLDFFYLQKWSLLAKVNIKWVQNLSQIAGNGHFSKISGRACLWRSLLAPHFKNPGSAPESNRYNKEREKQLGQWNWFWASGFYLLLDRLVGAEKSCLVSFHPCPHIPNKWFCYTLYFIRTSKFWPSLIVLKFLGNSSLSCS